jgi:plasmid stabilization system protein ParE
MSYRVVVSQQASGELEAAAHWWAEHRSQEQARRWYLGFSEELLTLGTFPERFPLAARGARIETS